MTRTKKTQTFRFPVVAWDDVEGCDVWVGDVIASVNDPLAGKIENEEYLAKLAEEICTGVFVVRTL